MNTYKNPVWWKPDNDYAWDHVKLAMKHDWEQTKPGEEQNTKQSFDHVAKQTSELESVSPLGRLSFEELEPACRFGYGARLKYGMEYPEWDDNLEIRLAKDWRTMHPARQETWEQDRSAIRYGWNFEAENLLQLEEW